MEINRILIIIVIFICARVHYIYSANGEHFHNSIRYQIPQKHLKKFSKIFGKSVRESNNPKIIKKFKFFSKTEKELSKCVFLIIRKSRKKLKLLVHNKLQIKNCRGGQEMKSRSDAAEVKKLQIHINRQNQNIENMSQSLKINKTLGINNQKERSLRNRNINSDLLNYKIQGIIEAKDISHEYFRNKALEKSDKESKLLMIDKKWNKLMMILNTLGLNPDDFNQNQQSILDYLQNKNNIRMKNNSQSSNINKNRKMKEFLQMNDQNMCFKLTTNDLLESKKQIRRRNSYGNHIIDHNLKQNNIQNVKFDQQLIPSQENGVNKNAKQIEDFNDNESDLMEDSAFEISLTRNNSLRNSFKNSLIDNQPIFKKISLEKLKHPQISIQMDKLVENTNFLNNLNNKLSIVSLSTKIIKTETKKVKLAERNSILLADDVNFDLKQTKLDADNVLSNDIQMKLSTLHFYQYNILRMNLYQVGIMTVNNPFLKPSSRKAKRVCQTIRQLSQLAKEKGSTQDIFKVSINKDKSLKFYETLIKLKECSAIQSKILIKNWDQFSDQLTMLKQHKRVIQIKVVHNIEVKLKYFFKQIEKQIIERHDQYLQYKSIMLNKFDHQLKQLMIESMDGYDPNARYDNSYLNIFEKLTSKNYNLKSNFNSFIKTPIRQNKIENNIQSKVKFKSRKKDMTPQPLKRNQSNLDKDKSRLQSRPWDIEFDESTISNNKSSLPEIVDKKIKKRFLENSKSSKQINQSNNKYQNTSIFKSKDHDLVLPDISKKSVNQLDLNQAKLIYTVMN